MSRSRRDAASKETGPPPRHWHHPRVLTAFGAAAVTLMMAMYALERRHRRYVLAFACCCLLSSTYGFLAGTWPFGVVEAIWAIVALHRYRLLRAADHRPASGLPDRESRLRRRARPG